MSYLSHYKCMKCGTVYSLLENTITCKECDHMLFAEYDMYKARKEMYEKRFKEGTSIWKYRDLLPVINGQEIVSMNEGVNRFTVLTKIAADNSVRLIVADEGFNPSGSLRDREMSVVFSVLQKKLKDGFLLGGTPSSCISGAAYAAHLGVKCRVLHFFAVFRGIEFLWRQNTFLRPLAKTAGRSGTENPGGRKPL